MAKASLPIITYYVGLSQFDFVYVYCLVLLGFSKKISVSFLLVLLSVLELAVINHCYMHRKVTLEVFCISGYWVAV